jgi:chromosome segregation ATPase
MAEKSAVDEAVDTSSQSEEGQALESATELAEDNIDALRSRLKDFEDRLTKAGRSEKQVKDQTESLKNQLKDRTAELAEAKKNLEKWNETYYNRWAPETDKVAFQRQQQFKQQQEQMTSAQREKMWQEIAEEDDPGVRSALKEAVNAGEYLGPAAIKAIRNTLTQRKVETEQTEEKAPPKISSTRTTGSVGKPTLEQQVEAVKNDKTRNKQEKAQEIVAIYSQIAARDSAARRAS